MDDLDLIRGLRADPSAVELERRERARARLEAHIAGERGVRRGRTWGWALGAGLAALIAGGVILATLGGAEPARDRAARGAASPAELLREAAATARAAPPPPALARGYWYTRVDRLESRSGPYRHDLRFREERWTDLDGQGRMRIDLRGVRFPTARDRRRHDRQGAPFTKRPRGVEDVGGERLAVDVRGWPLGENLFDLRGVRALPADPPALAARVRRLVGADGNVLADLGRVLGEAPLAPGTRAAAFEVLAGLPGLRLAARPEGLGPLPGGVAFVAASGGRRANVETTLAFDPATGRVLGQVTVLVRASGRGGAGRFRDGDRIGEERYVLGAAVGSLRERP